MSPIESVESIYEILRTVVPSKGPNDYGALATADAEGLACVRMVVLRGLRADENLLWINTNARSSKVAHLRHNPEAEVVLWLARRKTQLRLRATWRVVDQTLAARSPNLADLRQEAWMSQPAMARRLYAWPAPEQPLWEEAPARPKKRVNVRTAPPPFAVLLGNISRIDALRLTRPMHERFTFVRERNVWRAQRVTP